MNNLRQRAENALQDFIIKPEEYSLEAAQKLIHELRVHQIELEMQNDELRRLYQELEASRNRYADLYDFAPVGYLTTAENGLIVEANLTCAAMFGFDRSSLLKLSMAHLICKEDQDTFYLHRRKILETKSPQSCDLRMRRKDIGQNSPPGRGQGWVEGDEQAIPSVTHPQPLPGGEFTATYFYAHLDCVPVLDHAENVTHIRMAVTDITERKQMENQLKARLKEREVLLQEVYHRIKNNFYAVSSLLYLQANAADDPRIRQILEESMSRVQSMAYIHQKLYQSDNLAEIDFGDCLYTIAAELFHVYQVSVARVALNTRLDPVLLIAEQAIPCALLANELVSNALKHAFPEKRSGEIRFELAEQDHQVRLVISDNGVGIPEEVDLQQIKSLGLELAQGFVQQLKGTLTLDRNGGTTFSIRFPKKIV
jgi:two-component sensor histidine kinase/PAS domain-containing protein